MKTTKDLRNPRPDNQEPPYTGRRWLAGVLIVTLLFIALPGLFLHIAIQYAEANSNGGMQVLAGWLLELLIFPSVMISAALGAVSVFGVMVSYRGKKSQKVTLFAGGALIVIGIIYICVSVLV